MTEVLSSVINYITDIMRVMGPISGVFLIILESIFPVLPLAVFIALNIIVFGSIWGFLISWFATLIGCYLSFWVFRRGFSKYIYKKAETAEKLDQIMDTITDIKFTSLVLIIAIPFTPAFLVNIACGLSQMKRIKFIAAIIIGKLSIVYFWGYIGKSFLESVQDPIILIKVGLLLLIAYLISLFIGKKYHLK